MILREFLYVDTDKVRGMLAQLDDGIAEQQRTTVKNDKATEGGFRGVIGHQRMWGEETHLDKSLGDTLFPALEAALESEGLLQDISAELAEPDYWTNGLRAHHPPGSLVRVTSMGALFDARYVAASLAGFAATYSGITGMAVGAEGGSATKGTGGKPLKAGGKQPRRTRDPKDDGGAPELEDAIVEFEPMRGQEGVSISPELLRGMVKVSRGIFAPGLHLNLTPTNDDQMIVGARLQEGRRFLDSDAEVLFARYGTALQEWTVVGTIGHYSSDEDAKIPAFGNMVSSGSQVVRGRVARQINSFLRYLGTVGFADVPQYPGFSIVPLAAYRGILRNRELAETGSSSS